MRKTLFTSIAVFLLAVASSGAAEARCWWTGYHWACPASPYAYRAYGGYNDPAFGYYNRSRGLSPYAAFGAASHMGPDPGGGYRHAGASNVGHTD